MAILILIFTLIFLGKIWRSIQKNGVTIDKEKEVLKGIYLKDKNKVLVGIKQFSIEKGYDIKSGQVVHGVVIDKVFYVKELGK
jgi:hypothetical protein